MITPTVRRFLEYVLKKALEISFDRFIEPKASLEALEDFKESNDTVKAFVMEWFDKFESTASRQGICGGCIKNGAKMKGITKLTKRKFENQLAKTSLPNGLKRDFVPLGSSSRLQMFHLTIWDSFGLMMKTRNLQRDMKSYRLVTV